MCLCAKSIRYRLDVCRLCWLFVFTLAGADIGAAQSPQAVLAIPEVLMIVRSDTGNVIPISLDNAAAGAVRGVQIFLSFPPNALEILGVESTARTRIDSVRGNLAQPGDFRIVFLNTDGANPIVPGTGPIANLRVNAPENTPRGTAVPIQFVQDGTNATAIFDIHGNPLSLTVRGGTVVVTVPVLALAVTPQKPVVPVGRVVQFTAIADFKDGTSDTMTAEATWTSSNPTVAPVDSVGRALALMPGVSAIIAALHGISSLPDTLTVVPDTLPPVLVKGPAESIDVNQVVTITWETDEPSISLIEFGDTPAYGSIVSDSSFVTMHRLSATILLADTLFYRLQSVDHSGNRYISPGFFLPF